MMESDNKSQAIAVKSETTPDTRSAGSLTLDASKYLPYMTGFELTEAQQIELLKALWSIMKTFVDLSFGLDSVQQLFPAVVMNALADAPTDVNKESDQSTDERVTCDKGILS